MGSVGKPVGNAFTVPVESRLMHATMHIYTWFSIRALLGTIQTPSITDRLPLAQRFGYGYGSFSLTIPNSRRFQQLTVRSQ